MGELGGRCGLTHVQSNRSCIFISAVSIEFALYNAQRVEQRLVHLYIGEYDTSKVCRECHYHTAKVQGRKRKQISRVMQNSR